MPDDDKPKSKRGQNTKGSKPKVGRSREGSVDQLPSGRYRARVTETDGSRTSLKAHDNEKEAWAAIRRELGLHALNLHIDEDRAKTPFREVYEEMLLGLGGSSGTQGDRRKFAARVIYGTSKPTLPQDVLGGVRIGTLTKAKVDRWSLGLEGRLSGGVIKKWISMISQTLDFAKDEGYIRENPIKGRKMGPKADKTYHYLLTLDEIVLLTWAADAEHTLMHEVSFWTGLRQGETRALTPRVLDKRRRQIRVEAAIGPADEGSRFGVPKTISSFRNVPCPGPIFDALVKRAEGVPADSPLFPNPEGAWLAVDWYSKDIARIRKRAGILGDPYDPNPGRRVPPHIHDARATVASFLSAAGVPVSAAQAVLGHSSSSVTLDVYTQVSDFLNADPAIREARLQGLDAHEVLELLYRVAWEERAPVLEAAFSEPSAHVPNRGGRPRRKPGEPWNTGKLVPLRVRAGARKTP